VLRHADRPASGSLPQRALLAAAVSDPSALTLRWPVLWKAGVCGGVAQHSLIRTCSVARPGQWGILDQHDTLVLLSRHLYHDSLKDWWCSIIALCVDGYGREMNDSLRF
jgi:hypothetical protein